jgi:hypothetical protein
MWWTDFVACVENMKHAYRYKILVGKSDRKRPLGRRRHRCEDFFKMEPKGNDV